MPAPQPTATLTGDVIHPVPPARIPDLAQSLSMGEQMPVALYNGTCSAQDFQLKTTFYKKGAREEEGTYRVK